MIPQSVLIGLVVAAVGYFLQKRSWRHNKREEIRQKEYDESVEIIESLSRAVEKRISATSTFLSKVNSESVEREDEKLYNDAVREWMQEFSTFKTKIYHYFGGRKAIDFEKFVHGSLREASDIVLRTHRLGKRKLSSKHLAEHNSCNEKLTEARYKAYRLLKELNEMTANEETSRISMYDNVNSSNLDLVSRFYLIQRLLGLKS